MRWRSRSARSSSRSCPLSPLRFSNSGPPRRFLVDLHHADVAGEVRIIPLFGHVGPRTDQHIHGLWLRLSRPPRRRCCFARCYRIPDESWRQRVWMERVRCGSLGHCASRIGSQHRRVVRDLVHLWLESISLAVLVATIEARYIVIGIVKMIAVETETDWSAVMARRCWLVTAVVVVVLMQRCLSPD